MRRILRKVAYIFLTYACSFNLDLKAESPILEMIDRYSVVEKKIVITGKYSAYQANKLEFDLIRSAEISSEYYLGGMPSFKINLANDKLRYFQSNPAKYLKSNIDVTYDGKSWLVITHTPNSDAYGQAVITDQCPDFLDPLHLINLSNVFVQHVRIPFSKTLSCSIREAITRSSAGDTLLPKLNIDFQGGINRGKISLNDSCTTREIDVGSDGLVKKYTLVFNVCDKGKARLKHITYIDYTGNKMAKIRKEFYRDDKIYTKAELIVTSVSITDSLDSDFALKVPVKTSLMDQRNNNYYKIDSDEIELSPTTPK